jgi:phage terminase large subunit GpA-like protein
MTAGPLVAEVRGLERAIAKAFSRFRPKPKMRAADWCARYLRMPVQTSAIPGHWAADIFPYQAGVLDAFGDPGVEQMGLGWGTQLGKTSLLVAILCYCADQQPGPALIGGASEQSVKELMTTRVYPILEACPRTRLLMLPERDRQDFLVDLRGMLVFTAWSGSVTRLGEKSIRYDLLTEIDKWSRATTLEADPVSLAEQRTKAYPNAKIIREGTYTVAGMSRLEAFEKTAQRLDYFVPCPHCGAYQRLLLAQIRWPHDEAGKSCTPEVARDEAWYECSECKGRIDDVHKRQMLLGGWWGESAEGGSVTVRARRVLFHLASWYSPLLTWGTVAEKWLRAQEDPAELQAFVNGWAAEVWKGQEKEQDWKAVGERLRGDYGPGEVPPEALLLVAGADVQIDRFVYVIRAWGPGLTSWLIRCGEVEQAEDLVSAVLAPRFPWRGDAMSVRSLALDTRYRTEEAYEFARLHRDQVVAVKGFGAESARDWDRFRLRRVDRYPSGKPIPGGLHYYQVEVDRYKELIYGKFFILAGEPGAFNLHRETPVEYVRQLCGERQQKRWDARGHEQYQWVVVDRNVGNDYLDAEVYCAALADMLRVRELRAAPAPGQEGKPEGRRPGPTSWIRRPPGPWINR